MKTVYDQDDILFNIIANSALVDEITGSVYRGEQPPNSVKENIVINSLPVTVGDVQDGTSNVNIHVPDVIITEEGGQYKVADKRRMKELTDIAKSILESHVGDYFGFHTSFIGEFEEVDAGNNYINFRIEFTFHNN